MESTNQFIKLVSNLTTLFSAFRSLMQKNKPFLWAKKHLEAFEKMETEVSKSIMNYHIVEVKKKVTATLHIRDSSEQKWASIEQNRNSFGKLKRSHQIL